MPTLYAFGPTEYYVNVSKTLEKLGYDVYLRGLCLSKMFHENPVREGGDELRHSYLIFKKRLCTM